MNDIQKECVVRRRFEIIEDCRACKYFVSRTVVDWDYETDEKCTNVGFYFCVRDENSFKRWWFDQIWPKCVKNKEEK